jgi:Spy/CpxP family protein refolding chaperone
MKRIATATVIGTLVVLFGVVNAEARPGRGGHFKGMRIKRLLQEISLTAEQQEEIKSLSENVLVEARALGKEARTLHKQMRTLWKEENPDSTAIKTLYNKIHELHGQMAELYIDYRVNAMAILTPEQRAELRAKMAERSAKMGKKRGNGRGRGMNQG